MANQFITGEMLGTCANNETTDGLFNTWEMGYYHYHHRMGLTLPKTEQLLKQKVSVRGWSALNIFYETLIHGDPKVNDAIINSIVKVNKNNTITIYPNPSCGGIFKLSHQLTWQVYNGIGLKVKKGKGTIINLSDQNRGLYFVKTDNQVLKVYIK